MQDYSHYADESFVAAARERYMDAAELQKMADRILDRYLQGRRQGSYTVDNLVALLTTAQEHRAHLLHCLRDRLLDALVRPPVELASRMVRDPSVIEVVMDTFAQVGEAQSLFLQLFEYFPPEEPILLRNWTRQVLPTMTSAVLLHRDQLPSSFLASLKAQCELYIQDPRRQLFGIDQLHEGLLLAVTQLKDAIEDVEFSEFEAKLKAAAKTLGSSPPIDVAPQDQEGITGRVPRQIAEALSKADDCLRSKGQFDPKIAGDLLRTSIDVAHRAIVDELCSSEAPFSGQDKDGARREYLREQGFISPAEEKFFSSVYTLISNEGTHRLDAPRETFLLMHQTVAGYIELLFQRLTSRNKREAAAEL